MRSVEVVDRKAHVTESREELRDTPKLCVEAVDALEHDHARVRAVGAGAGQIGLHLAAVDVDFEFL